MIPHWIISFWNSIGIPAVWLILLQLIASIVLIQVNDRYSRSRAARIGSSIRKLEALYALEDNRDSRSRRSWKQR